MCIAYLLRHLFKDLSQWHSEWSLDHSECALRLFNSSSKFKAKKVFVFVHLPIIYCIILLAYWQIDLSQQCVSR